MTAVLPTLVDTSSDPRKIMDVHGASIVCRDLNPSDGVFSVSLAPNIVYTGGTPGAPATINDAVFSTSGAAAANSTMNVSASVPLDCPLPVQPSGITLTNLTPGIATLDTSTGVTTYVSSGTAQIRVSCPPFNDKLATFSSQQISNTTQYTFQNFTMGSLGAALVSTVSGMVSGKTAGPTYQDIYSTCPPFDSTADQTAATYVRNTSVFTGVVGSGGVDLTCIPSWGSDLAPFEQSTRYMGTLITPQHVMMAAHAHPSSGTLQFVGNDNSVTNRTIIAQSTAFVYGSDMLLVMLNEPVPTTGSGAITPAQLLPANYVSHMPSLSNGGVINAPFGYPAIYHNQFRSLQIADFVNCTPTLASVEESYDGRFSPWWTAVITGDSGSGGFLIINGSLVLILGIHGFYGSNAVIVGTPVYGQQTAPWLDGASYGDNLEAINAAVLAELSNANETNGSPSTVYTVTQANLSSFTP